MYMSHDDVIIQNQQEGLSAMVEMMKKSFSDLEIIETGLNEESGKRF